MRVWTIVRRVLAVSRIPGEEAVVEAVVEAAEEEGEEVADAGF